MLLGCAEVRCWARRYIPNRRLQFEYPDNYSAAELEDCLQDSNVLDRPEVLGGRGGEGEGGQPACEAQEHATAECGRER